MANLIVNIIYVILYVALIVYIDLKYLRYDFWKRLVVNVVIVLVAVTLYYLFLVNF